MTMVIIDKAVSASDASQIRSFFEWLWGDGINLIHGQPIGIHSTIQLDYGPSEFKAVDYQGLNEGKEEPIRVIDSVEPIPRIDPIPRIEPIPSPEPPIEKQGDPMDQVRYKDE